MHELSMTTQIVENVLEEAKNHDAKKVTEVHLVIGKMTFLGTEQIRFCYNILTENTIMKNSELIIEENEGIIECSTCGYRGLIKQTDDPTYHLSIPTLSCPTCGKTAKIIEGKECTIKSIRMIKQENINETKK